MQGKVMNKLNIEQQENIFTKYKKWIVAGVGLHLLPTIVCFAGIIGYGTYSYFTSEIRWHPYQRYIYGGYNIGIEDGAKDRKGTTSMDSNRSYLDNIPWVIYEEETRKLKKQALEEKDKYLAEIPSDKRGEKLAEMKLDNFKLPLEVELDKRFDQAIDFYTDYVAKRVKREDYKNDAKYQKALEREAWVAGYEYGYARGRVRDCKPGSL